MHSASAVNGNRSTPLANTALRFDAIPVRNQLLAALSSSDLADIAPHFETMHVDAPTALFGAGESIEYVYFPETTVVSIVNTHHGERTVEVGSVGHEGMAGLAAFLDGGVSPLKAFAQIPGYARRMDAKVFRQLAAAPG